MRILKAVIVALIILGVSAANGAPTENNRDVIAHIDQAVANIRKNFPGEFEERLGLYRTSYFRLASPAKIRSLLEQDQKLPGGVAPDIWITEWQSIDTEAGIAIREAAIASNLPTDQVQAITKQLALGAFKVGAWQQGEQLVALAGPENFSQRQWIDIVTANASAGRIGEAEKFFAYVKLPASIEDGRNYAFYLGLAGFVSAIRKIAESYDGEKNVAMVFAAAINGTSLEQRTHETEVLIRQLIGGSIRQITAERLIEGQGDGWSTSLLDCRSGVKRVTTPFVASHAQQQPSFDCFPTQTGLVSGLAMAAFRAGKRDLAIEILDRGSTALLERIPWDDAEFVKEIRYGGRRPTRDEMERVSRYENLVSSLIQMVSVAGTLESPEIARKLLPTLQSRELLGPSLLFAFRNSSSELEDFLTLIDDNMRLAWRLSFLRLAIKQNKPDQAVEYFRDAFEKAKEQQPHIFWIFYEEFRSAPNEATEAIKQWYVQHARAAISKSNERSYNLSSFGDFLYEVEELDLLKELSMEVARRVHREFTNEKLWHDSRTRGHKLAQAALNSMQADQNFDVDWALGGEKDVTVVGYFHSHMVDAYAQTNQIEKSQRLADEMSLSYPDVRFYPDYLREAWGHLAHAYARRGKIKEALAIIGDGKAGKPGGTIDAIVDGWIAAGHYKRQ